MEVFLVYKQFCNIKDVLSKPYDKLTYEDQLKMYDPLLFSLDELLEYEMVGDAQEGGRKNSKKKKKNTEEGAGEEGAGAGEAGAGEAAPAEAPAEAGEGAGAVNPKGKKSQANETAKKAKEQAQPANSGDKKLEKGDPGFGGDEKETAAAGVKKMLQNLLKILVIIILIVGIPLFPWIAIIYYTWGRFRTLYIRVIEPM